MESPDLGKWAVKERRSSTADYKAPVGRISSGASISHDPTKRTLHTRTLHIPKGVCDWPPHTHVAHPDDGFGKHQVKVLESLLEPLDLTKLSAPNYTTKMR